MLAIGIAVVLGGIVLLRVNAFIALLSAALAVSFLVGADIPDSAAELTDPVVRVVDGFGATAGAIGIVIALAAVIGEAMMRSGAADRIVSLEAVDRIRAAFAEHPEVTVAVHPGAGHGFSHLGTRSGQPAAAEAAAIRLETMLQSLRDVSN